MFRRLPPARSPLSAGALLAGLRAALVPAAGVAVERRVENALRALYRSRAVLLTDSGTSALALALRHTAASDARPAALPAFACFDVATATDTAQVPFVLYDIDPSTLGPDPTSLRRALQAGADRVVIVHLYGIPVDLGMVREIAAPFGAFIIEDAAQGTGGSLNGLPLGGHGSLAVLSFGRGKGLTGGSGGALFANDGRGEVALAMVPRLASTRGSVLDFAKLVAQWSLSGPALYRIPSSLPFLGLGTTPYQPPHQPGPPSALALGVLEHSLAVATGEAATRRLNAERMLSLVNRSRMTPVRITAGGEAGYLRLPLVGRTPWSRTPRVDVEAELGIMRGYPFALVDLENFGLRRIGGHEEFRGARMLAERLITVPVHGSLRNDDLRRLGDWCAADPILGTR